MEASLIFNTAWGHKHNKEWWHLLEIPAMALERIRLEIGHMGEITNDMLRLLGSAFSDRDLEKFQGGANNGR